MTTAQLACFDDEAHVRDAAAGRSLCAAGPVAAAAASLSPLADTLAVIAAGTLDQLGGDLGTIAAASSAVLVIGAPDGAHHALADLVQRLRTAGLAVASGWLLDAEGSATHDPRCPVVVVGTGDVATLVGTGAQSLRLDPDVDTLATLATLGCRARVCIVSYEVVGPVHNGGIGTANTSLALRLADAGLDVTLLFTGTPSGDEQRERWTSHFASCDVAYAELDAEAIAAVDSPHLNVRRAWAAYQWVRRAHQREPFDVIHAPDCQGHGVFIALAKRHGIAFATTTLAIGVHSPTRWCAEANRHPLTTLDSVADDHLERTAVELADVVISPSAYLLGYLRVRGWRLPQRSFVQQYTRSDAVLAAARMAPAAVRTKPTELVFFGRLEARKGLELFCSALDLLAASGVADGIAVTFLGSDVTMNGERSTSYIEDRAVRWPWKVQIETSLSQPEAVAHLHGASCLAVMPSLVDNSPNTVYEALALGVPFVASRSGGTGELIAPEDLDRCSFDVAASTDVVLPVPPGSRPPHFDATGLAGVLERALTQPAAAARPAIDAAQNEAAHIAWHVGAAVAARSRSAPATGGAGRVRLLTGESSDAELDRPGELFAFVGDAFGAVAALPGVVRRAAASSDADILLLVSRTEVIGGGPATVHVPIGGPALLALSYPFFGDAFAIRTEAFRQLGGFDHALPPAEQGRDLLTRAAIAGLRLEVLPEALGERAPAPSAAGGDNLDLWLEAVPWPSSGELQLARLRPFVQAAGSLQLADLPGLLRGGQEILARFRAHHHDLAARWVEHYDEALAWGHATTAAYDRLQTHADRLQTHAHRLEAYNEHLQGHVDRLQAHTDRLQAHTDRLQGHADRVQVHTNHLQAHTDRLQAHTDGLQAHTDRLQQAHDIQLARADWLDRELAAVHASSSWRLTERVRRVRTTLGPWWPGALRPRALAATDATHLDVVALSRDARRPDRQAGGLPATSRPDGPRSANSAAVRPAAHPSRLVADG